jgi:NADPH2:quinone reductase
MAETLPETMNRIEVAEPGEPEAMTLAQAPVPSPAAGEVLIKSAGAGINWVDCLQRQGKAKAPPGHPEILGLDTAGTVAAVGDGVTEWRVGDEVWAALAGGGYAEYCIAQADHCLAVPKGLDAVQAAGLPLVCFTVWPNVFERGRLKPGETLLVHGGASGVGTMAIQIARALGSRVIATAGGAERCEACVSLGAERAVNYHDEDFVEAAKEFTGGAGINVILDMVGGDYLARNVAALATDGRLIHVGFARGSTVEVDLRSWMVKRITVNGTSFRPQPAEMKAATARALKENVWPLIEAGTVKPVIHATFPLAQAAEAHRLMETGAQIGKVVLTP